jgi:DNA-binding transcriptional LysR family regulator
VSVEVRGRLVVSNSLAVRDAVLAGAGIGLLPRFYVYGELAEGRLVSLLPGLEPPRVTVSAVYARARILPPKLRVVVDFLRARFSAAQWADAGR